MVDRIRDRCRDAGDADLANALRADGADMQVRLLDKRDVDRTDVRVHRHMVLREISIYIAAGSRVDERFLFERHADAPDDAADDLAAGRLRGHHTMAIADGRSPAARASAGAPSPRRARRSPSMPR